MNTLSSEAILPFNKVTHLCVFRITCHVNRLSAINGVYTNQNTSVSLEWISTDIWHKLHWIYKGFNPYWKLTSNLPYIQLFGFCRCHGRANIETRYTVSGQTKTDTASSPIIWGLCLIITKKSTTECCYSYNLMVLFLPPPTWKLSEVWIMHQYHNMNGPDTQVKFQRKCEHIWMFGQWFLIETRLLFLKLGDRRYHFGTKNRPFILYLAPFDTVFRMHTTITLELIRTCG